MYKEGVEHCPVLVVDGVSQANIFLNGSDIDNWNVKFQNCSETLPLAVYSGTNIQELDGNWCVLNLIIVKLHRFGIPQSLKLIKKRIRPGSGS